MQERREKGLCYNCDEKYQMGHKCIKPKLFLLERVEFEEDTYELEEVQNSIDQIPHKAELLIISLHALAGVPSP